MYDSFDQHYQATIGIDFLSKTLQIDDNTVRLQVSDSIVSLFQFIIHQLWDTAGQERFRSLIPSYIRDSNVGIIVYNVTEEKSFAKIDNWIKDVKDQRGEDVIIFLVGNKTDLEGKQKVETSVAEKKAAEHNVHFIETSAKSGYNVNALFQRIARAITG